jgi:hypothetical protein
VETFRASEAFPSVKSESAMPISLVVQQAMQAINKTVGGREIGA